MSTGCPPSRRSLSCWSHLSVSSLTFGFHPNDARDFRLPKVLRRSTEAPSPRPKLRRRSWCRGRLCQQIQAFLFDYAELSRELNIAGALVDKRHDAEYPQTAYGQPLPLMVPWKFLLTRLSQVNHLRQFNALVDNVDTTTQTTRQSTVLTPLTGGPARPMLRSSN